MRHLFAPLLARSETAPDSLFALVVRGGDEVRLTNRGVIDRASVFGRAARASGCVDGDIVLLVLDHCEHLYPAFIGCVLAKLIPSFIAPLTRQQDPDVYRKSTQALLERIRPKAIFASAKAAEAFPRSDAPLILVDSLPRSDIDATIEQRGRSLEIDQSDVAFLQHSSGTTGLKKGVMLTHRAVLDQCQSYGDAIDMHAEETVVSWLPLYHDMGLIACFLLPAIRGASIISLDAQEWTLRPTVLLSRIEQHRAHYAWLPNFAFQHIVRLDRGNRLFDLTSVKAIISCSEPCRIATYEAFAQKYSAQGLTREKLQTSYALAENVFAATQSVLGSIVQGLTVADAKGFASSGKPLPNVEIEIRAPNGSRLGPDLSGEIWLRSSCLFEGYFGQEELIEKKLQDGWYQTGDIGLFSNNELYVIGRVDDMIIVNGKNLIAHEVEDILNQIDSLAPGRNLVHGRYSEELGTTELVVVAEPREPLDEIDAIHASIRGAVYSQAGIYPAHVAIVERGFLIKSSSGKIARSASYEKFVGRHEKHV